MSPGNAPDVMIEKLSRISLFTSVASEKESMQRLASLFETISLQEGETVIREGEEGDTLFIIKSGTVDVIKRTRQGDPYTVASLTGEMNGFFGELALLDKENRSATVRCLTKCEFYVLKRDVFTKFGDENPSEGLAITRELSRIVSKRLRKANADIIVLFDALVEEVSQSGGLANQN